VPRDRFLPFPFEDHVDYARPAVIGEIREAARYRDVILTSAKDAVKLRRVAGGLPAIGVIQSRVRFLTRQDELLKQIFL